ncbi:MAG TPA: hypothetical protein VMU95_02170 [Trebonia sp.]|nr:hypothetical protein [Trebonia sp.]
MVTTVWLLDSWFRPIRPELIPADRNPFRPLWPLRLGILLVLLCVFGLTLPNQVNAVAYLTGQAPTVTFIPQSHSRQCSQKEPANCSTSTSGVRLDTGGRVVYPGAIPVGQPTPLRASLLGQQLLTDGSADQDLFVGMVVDVALASALAGYVVRWLGRGRPLPWRPRPLPEEDPFPARPANGGTRNTARKKLQRQRRRR